MAFWRLAHGLNLKQKPPILERLLQIREYEMIRQLFPPASWQSSSSACALDGKVIAACFQEKGIKPAAVLNRLEGVGADAETVGEAHGIADQADIAQVRQKKAPPNLVVGMAHIVARQWVLACQLANSSHGTYSAI